MPGPHLLVSVRDATEAAAALAGGADLIDVKEPSRGPLGRADPATIATVIQAVGGRVPVSAALGELRESPLFDTEIGGLQFVKWGLSGLSGKRWSGLLSDAQLAMLQSRTVAVVYADWVRAAAPRPMDVIAFAVESEMTAILFDTFQKDGSTLLDWMSVEAIRAMVQSCHDARVKVALAGSLTAAEIIRLRAVLPDWFAVRGAACDDGRGGTLSERRVRELADLVHSLAL